MRAFKLSALGAAVMAATAAQASVDQFVDDSSLTLTYKVYNWNTETKQADGSYKEKQDEFVHALIADFKSGYYADMIGFDIQTGFAQDINTNDKYSTTNLPQDSNGHVDDIAGVQQAYLKAKFGGEDLNFHGTYGQKKRGLQTYNDSGSRILNASSFGVDGSVNFYDVNVYATRIDAFSARNHSEFNDDLTNGDGQKIDNITIFGAGYEKNGLGGVIEQAKSKDYLKKSFAKVYYSLPISEGISVDMDARFGKVEKDGDLYTTDFVDPATNDFESQYHNLNATLNYGNAYVGLGYNKTKDGDYDNTMFSDDNGTFNSSLDLEMGYNYEDETAYVLRAGYDFADYIPGLAVDVWYAKGKDAKNFDNFSQKEFGTNVSYSFSGMLDGLSVSYFHTTYRTSGDALTANADALGGMYNDNINKVYLTYTYEVF